jgi:hypothetical protein
MTIMTLEHMKIATVVAWAIICTVVAVSLVGSVGNWPLIVGSGVLPLLILSRTWHPPMRPAFAHMARK